MLIGIEYAVGLYMVVNCVRVAYSQLLLFFFIFEYIFVRVCYGILHRDVACHFVLILFLLYHYFTLKHQK